MGSKRGKLKGVEGKRNEEKHTVGYDTVPLTTVFSDSF